MPRIIVESFSKKFPNNVSEWYQEKNGSLTPDTISYNFKKKIWWRCTVDLDHIWDVAPINRIQSNSSLSGCPFCSSHRTNFSNSIATTHPHLVKEWHPEKNGNKKPENYIKGSSEEIWWICSSDRSHIWKSKIRSRTKRKGRCPICTGQLVVFENSIANTHPDLIKEWCFNRNVKKPEEITFGSHKKYWWKCVNGHIYECSVANKVRGRGCPFCSNKKVLKDESLYAKFPEIASEWLREKNKIGPEMVAPHSGKMFWWKCKEGDDHIWKATVDNRTIGKQGCAICSGKKVVKSNSLEFLYPKISREWAEDVNGSLKPSQVTAKSGKKVFWRCLNNPEHIWKTGIANRVNGTNCPFCSLTPQSRQELIITFELKLFFPRIDPKGYKTILNGRLRSIDIFIPDLNLALEFDGHYWHKGQRELDRIKSDLIIEKGFNLIRVREEPLKKIYSSDIVSKKPFDGKELTNSILKEILKLFKVSKETELKVNQYLIQKNLQNEKALDAYIEKILKAKQP